MAGFIRRFDAVPTLEVLTEIEAIDIVDLPPPFPTTGIGTGTLLCVGEFEDGPFAAGDDADEWDGDTYGRGPTEVYSSEDLRQRFGGFGFTYGSAVYENACARRHLTELWNGNGFLKLKFCRPKRLIVARVDTSVGRVAFQMIACIAGGAGPFRLAAGQKLVVTTDLGGPALSDAIAAVAATTVGVAGTFPTGFAGGESITVSVDGGPAVPVVFTAADQLAADVVAQINEALGFTVAAVDTGQVRLTGLQKGTGGDVTIADVSAGTLAVLGLVAGSYAGTGNVANLDAVTATEIATIVNGSAALAAIDAIAQVAADGTLRICSATPAVGSVEVPSGTFARALGVGGTYPTLFAGTEIMTVNIDGAGVVPIAFAAGDQSLAQVISRINTVFGSVIATQVGGELAITSPTEGAGGSVTLAETAGTPLATLGLVAGTSTAIDSMAADLALEPLDTTIEAGTHDAGTIPAGTRVRNVGGDEWITLQTLTIAAGTSAAPVGGAFLVKVRPALDDGTGLTAGAGTVDVVVDQPSFGSVVVTNPDSLSAALSESALDAAYEDAIAATLDPNTALHDVNFSLAARASDAVRAALRQNAIDASSEGHYGRKTIVGAPLGFSQLQAQTQVATLRHDRLSYTWPGWKVRIPEIARVGSAGGLGFTDNGVITVRADGPLATIVCRLPPEEDPGQQTGLIDAFNALEDLPGGAKLKISNYIALKAAGICAPRIDRQSGSIYQSGVTSDLTPGKTTQARRKMADFIQDTIADRLVTESKKLNKPSRRAGLRAIVDQFLNSLLSTTQPELQRIDSYSIDETSGNTPDSLALGIFVMIIRVRTLSSLQAIVLQTEIGEGVLTVTELAA